MTDDKFNEILERRLDLTRKVLASKATEYATGKDRLHNFRRTAATPLFRRTGAVGLPGQAPRLDRGLGR